MGNLIWQIDAKIMQEAEHFVWYSKFFCLLFFYLLWATWSTSIHQLMRKDNARRYDALPSWKIMQEVEHFHFVFCIKYFVWSFWYVFSKLISKGFVMCLAVLQFKLPAKFKFYQILLRKGIYKISFNWIAEKPFHWL